MIELVGMRFVVFAGYVAFVLTFGALAPWIPVVAVIVWHMSDPRHAIWRRQS